MVYLHILSAEEVFIEDTEDIGSDSDVIVTTTWRIRSDGDLEQELQEQIEADRTLDELDGLSVSSSFSTKSSSDDEGSGLYCERREDFEIITREKISKEELMNKSNDVFEETGQSDVKVTQPTQYRSSQGEGCLSDTSSGLFNALRSESSIGESDVVEALYELARQVEREERHEVVSRSVWPSKDLLRSVLPSRDSLEPGKAFRDLYDFIIYNHSGCAFCQLHLLKCYNIPWFLGLCTLIMHVLVHHSWPYYC